jgi:4-hydroxy-tetrahydrodipicolinate synthase
VAHEAGGARVAWTWDEALCGVVPPLITPFVEPGEVDAVAYARLVEHVVAGGCSGLFVLGGCGEGAWLTSSQREATVAAAVAAAAGRVPVLAGAMLTATGLVCEAVRQAEAKGADAVVVGSPYYMEVDPAAIERHVEAVLRAVDIPVLLYNIPPATHSTLPPATVGRLGAEARVLGIKDSSGDLGTFQRYLAVKHDRPTFRVLQGNELCASSSLLLGGDGLVPGMANFAPALYVSLRSAAAEGDAARCATIQRVITDLWAIHAQGHWLTGLKAACEIVGLGDGVPSRPLVRAGDAARDAIRGILARNGIDPSPSTTT